MRVGIWSRNHPTLTKFPKLTKFKSTSYKESL